MTDFLYLPDVGAFDSWGKIPAGEYVGIQVEILIDGRAEPNLVTKRDDGLFHIRDYKDKIAKTYVCAKCGGNVFQVGTGSYFTAIRCVTCGWELCVHEG